MKYPWDVGTSHEVFLRCRSLSWSILEMQELFILSGCQNHVIWHFEVLMAVTVKIAVCSGLWHSADRLHIATSQKTQSSYLMFSCLYIVLINHGKRCMSHVFVNATLSEGSVSNARQLQKGLEQLEVDWKLIGPVLCLTLTRVYAQFFYALKKKRQMRRHTWKCAAQICVDKWLLSCCSTQVLTSSIHYIRLVFCHRKGKFGYCHTRFQN